MKEPNKLLTPLERDNIAEMQRIVAALTEIGELIGAALTLAEQRLQSAGVMLGMLHAAVEKERARKA